jgi:CheY-like chemotaxis protein
VHAPTAVEKKVDAFRKSCAGIRLLLAEDDLSSQFALRTLLVHFFGHRVDVASNGREALKLLEENDYDLVLMDCMMPDMDGYKATAAIRDRSSNVRNHAITIIAVTANAMWDDRNRCLAAGMNDYLPKPIDLEVLLAMLEKWI